MADETNDGKTGRLDRVEEILKVLANKRIQFQEEHRQRLEAQVLLHDALQKLAEALTETDRKLTARLTELAAAQAHTDEKMAALIGTVDELIRRPPVQ